MAIITEPNLDVRVCWLNSKYAKLAVVASVFEVSHVASVDEVA